ncbi:MAG: hypothetical protein ACM3S2_01295 [Ignavibacteriales bacterium]
MKTITLVILFNLVLFYNSFSQNHTHLPNDAIKSVWHYPNVPESSIAPYEKDTLLPAVCSPLPPESERTFGNIRGMGCDKDDNLYVWDDGYSALLKFSPDGKLLWRKKYARGKDEGAFINVGPAFAVSGKGYVCLGDKGNKTVSILDNNGSYMRRFDVNMWPATITFGDDETIYIAGFEMSYSGNIIHHYTLSGDKINSFCERKETSPAVAMSGNSGRLLKGENGNIYYAHFYPYLVEEYSKDGVLLSSIKKESAEFQPPQWTIREGSRIMESRAGLKGLTFIDKNYLSVVVFRKVSENDWTIDLYDTTARQKASLSNKDFPKDFLFRYWAADSKGNVYFDQDTKPEPVIIKYNINVKSLFQ